MAIDLFFVTTILATTIFLSTPIAFTFSGVMWAELSGVFVFGIEGSMLMSAVAGFLGTIATGNIVIGFLLGLGTGVVMGLLTAFFEVTLGADQVIFAIALLVLGPSLSSYLFDTYVALHSLSAFSTTIGTLPAIPVPYLSDIPLLGEFFKQSLLVYVMYVLVILTYVFFFYTKAGLRVRAAGMDPMAAETQGINVNRIRIIAVIISAVLAALGGMTMILAQTGFWADNITAGRGLLAIALVRVGNWKTPVVLASTFVVGFLFAISSYLQQYYAGTATAAFPYEIFNALPYVFAIVIIAISYKWTRSNQPTAIGQPYRRE